MIKINLNDTARVKLTPHGISLYRERMRALNRRLSRTAQPFSIDPPLDKDGYYRGELWHIMEEFGPHLGLGDFPPFEMTVLLGEDDTNE